MPETNPTNPEQVSPDAAESLQQPRRNRFPRRGGTEFIIWAVCLILVIGLAVIVVRAVNNIAANNSTSSISSTVPKHPDFTPTLLQQSVYLKAFAELKITHYTREAAETYGLNTCQYIKDENPTPRQIIAAITHSGGNPTEAGEAAGAGVIIFCPQYKKLITEAGNLDSK